MTEIYKIQLALDGSRTVLVYNEKRNHIGQFKRDLTFTKLLAGRFKVYAYATLDKKGKLRIEKEAPEQEW